MNTCDVCGKQFDSLEKLLKHEDKWNKAFEAGEKAAKETEIQLEELRKK